MVEVVNEVADCWLVDNDYKLILFCNAFVEVADEVADCWLVDKNLKEISWAVDNVVDGWFFR